MNLMTFRRARRAFAALILLSAALVNMLSPRPAAAAKKILVAHRGASAYAPEHTLEAYELAIKQGADFVEQDLQVTKDGVLVCLHDETLERTTNVEDVFPDRFIKESGGETVKRWYVADFTLEEIKQLDAGSWFGPQFKRARVPTFGEAIKLIRGRAGLYPETKAPEVYGRRGFEMERLLLAELKRHGLDRPGADARTPIYQSSAGEPAEDPRELKTRVAARAVNRQREPRATG